MKIIQLTPENHASVAGLMKKVFDSYDWKSTEMVIHDGTYSRRNKRLPKISDSTSRSAFSSAKATSKNSGIVIEATAKPCNTIRYWIHFGESVIFNDRKIFLVRKSLDGPGKFFGAFVPSPNTKKKECQPTERALQMYAARH